jgi:hypothetical protein
VRDGFGDRLAGGGGPGAIGGEPRELGLGSRDRRVERRRGHRLALERTPRRPDLVAQGLDELFRLAPRGADRVVPLAAGASPLFVGRAQCLGRAGLGRAGPLERLARLALGLADPGERLLERALVLRQSRARVGDDAGSRPRRSAIANAWLPPGRPIGEAVRRRERLEIELDRRVPAPPVVWA